MPSAIVGGQQFAPVVLHVSDDSQRFNHGFAGSEAYLVYQQSGPRSLHRSALSFSGPKWPMAPTFERFQAKLRQLLVRQMVPRVCRI